MDKELIVDCYRRVCVINGDSILTGMPTDEAVMTLYNFMNIFDVGFHPTKIGVYMNVDIEHKDGSLYTDEVLAEDIGSLGFDYDKDFVKNIESNYKKLVYQTKEENLRMISEFERSFDGEKDMFSEDGKPVSTMKISLYSITIEDGEDRTVMVRLDMDGRPSLYSVDDKIGLSFDAIYDCDMRRVVVNSLSVRREWG